MALGATIHRVEVGLSDVDRGVYEALDLRLARHPSESARYLVTRLLAYCLEHAEGIAFSKGGIAQADEPPVSIRDATGALLAWIDVGAPSAERLHRAAKAAPRVAVYTHLDAAHVQREAATRAIHRAAEIDVERLPAAVLEGLEAALDRALAFELVRSEGHLYATVGAARFDGALERMPLAP